MRSQQLASPTAGPTMPAARYGMTAHSAPDVTPEASVEP